MSGSNCCFLTCIQISQKQVRWSDIPISLRIFHTVCCDPHSQRLWYSQWSRSIRSGILLLLLWSSRCWKLDLWFTWLFSIQLEHLEVQGSHTVKSGLENSEHYFTSVWDECNCAVVWAFFGIAFLWDWNENWPFPVLWPLLRFPNLLAYWVQHFHSVIFRIWNSLTGIPSPPLALFVVMLPRAHLTLDSKMSGSRWVITPSWLSRSWRSFFV